MRYTEGVQEHDDSPYDHVGREDVGRMQFVQRKSFRLEKYTPAWAQSDQKVRLIVYQYLANYARFGNRFRVKAGMSMMQLEALCKELQVRHRRLNQEEHVRTTENGLAARLVSILYKAYRQRLKAPDIAEQMNMSSVLVRQILYRANNMARMMFPESEQIVTRKHRKPRANTAGRNPSSMMFLPPSASPEKIKAIAAEYNDGATLKQLSAKHGIPVPTISWQIRKYCLASPDRKNRGQFGKGGVKCLTQ